MSQAAFSIRRFQPEDTSPILALFVETVRAVNAAHYSPEQIAAWAPDPSERMDAARWREALERSHTLVAVDGETIVGFADLEPSTDDGGHLDHLYVHKHHQAKGIATALVEAIERVARERGDRRIFTEASLTARPFFARRGYETVAEQIVVLRGVAMPNVRMEKRL